MYGTVIWTEIFSKTELKCKCGCGLVLFLKWNFEIKTDECGYSHRCFCAPMKGSLKDLDADGVILLIGFTYFGTGKHLKHGEQLHEDQAWLRHASRSGPYWRGLQ